MDAQHATFHEKVFFSKRTDEEEAAEDKPSFPCIQFPFFSDPWDGHDIPEGANEHVELVHDWQTVNARVHSGRVPDCKLRFGEVNRGKESPNLSRMVSQHTG